MRIQCLVEKQEEKSLAGVEPAIFVNHLFIWN